MLRSSAIAVVTAATLLVTVVLPAEYGIDITGISRPLGLTAMGEIKSQLTAEAEAVRAATAPAQAPRSSLLGPIFARLLISSAAAHPNHTAARSDETFISLRPNQGQDLKLTMEEGDSATFSWTAQPDRSTSTCMVSRQPATRTATGTAGARPRIRASSLPPSTETTAGSSGTVLAPT